LTGFGIDLYPASRKSSPEHRFDARVRQRQRRIQAAYFGVRTVGTQKNRVQLVRHIPVGGVTALTRDQAQVFAA
jgi:hypothetical protein